MSKPQTPPLTDKRPDQPNDDATLARRTADDLRDVLDGLADRQARFQPSWHDALATYTAAMRVPDAAQYVLSEGAIRSAIGRPYHTFGGVEFYPALPAKAAALIGGAAKAHGFADGNKRFAVTITHTCIRMSGHDLPKAQRDTLDDVVVDLVTGERSKD